MRQDSFVFYDSFRDAVMDMADKDRLAFYEGIINYALDGTEPVLSPELNRMFKLVKPQLDANSKRKNDAKKGGRPKKKIIETIGKNYEKTTGFENKNQWISEKKPVDKTIKKPNVNVNVNNSSSTTTTNILDFVEEEFGRTLSPTEIEKILSFKNEELVRYAVEESVLSNVRNLRYIETIMFELEREGIKTYEAAKKSERSNKSEND